jgi:hypothetical protein
MTLRLQLFNASTTSADEDGGADPQRRGFP